MPKHEKERVKKSHRVGIAPLSNAPSLPELKYKTL